MSDLITLRRPDDWHLHLRDGAALAAVLPHTARQFSRAIVMPNLKPPVTTTRLAGEYRDRILAARPPGSDFQPLMTLYLTDNTPPVEVDRAKDSGFVAGFKMYPAGATTNSDSGVTDVRRTDAVLARMAELGVVLQVHGEVTHEHVDVFDREQRFIDDILGPLLERHPRLRVVFEHITTRAAVEFVRGARDGVAATITPQHLLHNRNDLFRGGIRPHFYCLPVLKTQQDRLALVEAATSGHPYLRLGVDNHKIGHALCHAERLPHGVFAVEPNGAIRTRFFEFSSQDVFYQPGNPANHRHWHSVHVGATRSRRQVGHGQRRCLARL